MAIPGPRLIEPGFISVEYLAGHIDADGSFGIQKGSTPFVRLRNTYPYVATYLQRVYGGRAFLARKARGNNRDLFEWSAHGDSARAFIAAIRDHLVEKQPQADIIAQIHRYPKHSAMRAEFQRNLDRLKRYQYELPVTRDRAD
jgi:hypothetical protein